MRISEPYKNNLRKIGVDMKIRVVQVAEYEERLTKFQIRYGGRQLSLKADLAG